jgi:hypothetical protein
MCNRLREGSSHVEAARGVVGATGLQVLSQDRDSSRHAARFHSTSLR